MRRIKRARLSPALLVAVIALVAALGGGAVAGVAVTALNHKERKQVKRISKKQAQKLDRRAIASIPAGPKGDPGPAGDPGADGVSGYAVDSAFYADGGAEVSWPPGEVRTSKFPCPDGKSVLGGGAEVITAFDTIPAGVSYEEELVTVASQPVDSNTAWQVSLRNDHGTDLKGWGYKVWGICADVEP